MCFLEKIYTLTKKTNGQNQGKPTVAFWRKFSWNIVVVLMGNIQDDVILPVQSWSFVLFMFVCLLAT